MARILVQLRVDKVTTREHNGTTYADAVEVESLYTADGEAASQRSTVVGLDLDQVGAVKKAQGQTVWLSVARMLAFGEGRNKFVKMIGGRLVDAAEPVSA